MKALKNYKKFIESIEKDDEIEGNYWCYLAEGYETAEGLVTIHGTLEEIEIELKELAKNWKGVREMANLERFQKMLEDLKTKCEESLMELDIDILENLFQLADLNKNNKLYAKTPEEAENVKAFDVNFKNLMKNLYVPSYQLNNV